MRIRTLLFMGILGCGEGSPAAAAPAQEKAPAWFEGTIVQREKVLGMPAALAGYAIRTTIGENRIRREISSKLAGLSTDASGLIVDLEKKEAIVYRSGLLKKYCCVLSLEDFAKAAAREKGRKTRRSHDRGYDPVFQSLDAPYAADVQIAVAIYLGRTCDRAVLSDLIERWTIAYSPEIRVKEALLKAVFPNLPKELKGYPLDIRYEIVRGKDTKWEDVDLPPWLRKTMAAMDKIDDILSLVQTEPAEVEPGAPPADAFALDPAFQKLATLDELDAKFPAPDLDD